MLTAKIQFVDIINKIPHKRVLQNISFNLEKGNVYTILGKNGSGKSTLINSLSDLLDKNIYKTSAEVKINGINIFSINYSELITIRKEKIRYVFQDSMNSFDPLKKFEYYFKMQNIEEKDYKDLLKYFLLPSKETLFKLHPYEVSGGMAQRISICLALAAKPQLLILDEPTSSIDFNISNLLCDKLREFVRDINSSVLLITQDLYFAEHVSDYIAELNNGTLSQFYKPMEYKKINHKI